MDVPIFDPTNAFGGQQWDAERQEWVVPAGATQNPAPHSPLAFRDRVAAYFRAHPDQWIDASVLQEIGGRYASRTRISDCRTQLGMVIKNRQRRERRQTISEYCFLPADHLFRLVADDAALSGEGGSEPK